MCDTCGCGDTRIVPVDVQARLLDANDRTAAHNRAHFRRRGVAAINLMGSPGAGKTAILEATARALVGTWRMAAMTGDLETARDADRLRSAGINATAITTGSACHLDAEMVHHALHSGVSDATDYLFIENVGNLVCPAIYDLGQAVNVVALSVAEGEDKPLKYPVMFRTADLVLLTKIDLLAALPEYDRSAVYAAVARVMPAPHVLEVSARTGTGIDAWLAWLGQLRTANAMAAGPQPHARGESA